MKPGPAPKLSCYEELILVTCYMACHSQASQLITKLLVRTSYCLTYFDFLNIHIVYIVPVQQCNFSIVKKSARYYKVPVSMTYIF